MKYLIYTMLFLIPLSGFSSEKLGQINDPDGFSNVRENQSSKSKVLFRVIDGEYFYFQENDSNTWFEITNMDGRKGFIHKSRITEIIEYEIKGKKYKSSETKLKIRKKYIGKIIVVITQISNLEDDYEFSCNSYLDLYNPDGEDKSIEFENIDALGGYFGISFLENIIPNHLLIVKHGDYDGITIIINDSGKLFNIGGGSVSKLIDNRFIISFGECDLGFCSFSIYDSKTNNIVLKHETEFEVYQYENTLIFDLDYGDGEDYKKFDTKTIELIKIDVTKDKLKYFDNFINYDIKNGCLCN